MGTGTRSLVECVKWTSPSSLVAGGIVMGLTHTPPQSPPGAIKLFADSGFIEHASGLFKAFELQ